MSVTCDWCGSAPHVTYPDCPTCRGRGHVVGGDSDRPCPGCRLRSMDKRSPFVRRAVDGDLPAKEIA